jgi:hypothetical protein
MRGVPPLMLAGDRHGQDRVCSTKIPLPGIPERTRDDIPDIERYPALAMPPEDPRRRRDSRPRKAPANRLTAEACIGSGGDELRRSS